MRFCPLDPIPKSDTARLGTWRRHDDAVICAYDRATFSGDTVIDAMRTHPMIIIRRILPQKPFFALAGFLREPSERRSRQTTSPSTV